MPKQQEHGGARWWQRGVFYQVYPRSFQDANGDGIGDLVGIISRLDYLNVPGEDGGNALGMDAVWLSPTFPSPMADFGYDVSDYTDVSPLFGTLDDMDRLIQASHERGIRVLLDFVPNHTSNQHPWFLAACCSRNNAKRAWYCWQDPRPGGSPPNNWLSAFGGRAWEWDETTRQFYLHSFLKEQPDLNWRNPEVVAAMHDVLRFWLRRGIDGFRVDALGMAIKDPLLRENPTNPDYRPDAGMPEHRQQLWTYNRNWPDVFELVRGLRRTIDEFPDRMLVGEVFGPPETLANFCGGAALDGLNLAFNFQLIGGYDEPYTRWDAQTVRAIVDAADAGLPEGTQPAWMLGNHDQPRLVSRLGGGELGLTRARAAAVLLLTLRGTPFIYYGEEIGMEDVPIAESRAQDPARFHARGRDPERTPMQWDNGTNGGFTGGEPWLPLGPSRRNVRDQAADADSILNLYRRLLRLRRSSAALYAGAYRAIDVESQGVFAYLREAGPESCLVAINFLDEAATIDLPRGLGHGRVACSTVRPREGDETAGRLYLAANEGCVVQSD